MGRTRNPDVAADIKRKSPGMLRDKWHEEREENRLEEAGV